ncbi:MAG TPA: UrcA family protein [Steroidobacteraceae bacterium]
MKTNPPSLVFGLITVAIHLAGFAAVEVGSRTLLAQTVSYHDLDLSRPADAAVLYQRIGAAAVEVCERFDAGKPARAPLRHECERRAIAATVARVTGTNLHGQRAAAVTVRAAAQS